MSDILGKLAGAALQNMLGGGAQGGPAGLGNSPLAAILAQILGAGMGGGTSGPGAGPAPQMAPAQAPGGLGGLSDLLQQFRQAGLGSKADSWVGSGENEPLAPHELAGVFSPEQIRQWAQQAGTDPQSLLAVLSQALPHVVDHMTPQGVPHAAPPAAPDLGAILSGLFGGRA